MSPDNPEPYSLAPNNVAMVEATSRGAPMNPSTGRTRGTRRDW